MSEICYYKVIVNGKKNACYKFMEFFPTEDYVIDVYKDGNDDNYTILFMGECADGIDAYANDENDAHKLLTDEIDKLDFYNDFEEFSKYTIKDRSIIFDVDVKCNSSLDNKNNYVHYDKGKEIFDKVPDILKIEKDFDPYDEEEIEKIEKLFKNTSKKKSQKINNKEEAFNYILNNPYAGLSKIDKSILDSEFVLSTIKKMKEISINSGYDEFITNVAKSTKLYKEDREFVIESAKLDGFYTLYVASEKFLNDKEIVKEDVKQCKESIGFVVNEPLFKDKEFLNSLMITDEYLNSKEYKELF